jgi:hypothetical protein
MNYGADAGADLVLIFTLDEGRSQFSVSHSDAFEEKRERGFRRFIFPD